MTIGAICNRKVITVKPEDSVFHAAALMRQHHIGDVVVVKQHQNNTIPIGIVTDRDVVVEITATGLDPQAITASDIMLTKIETIKDSAGILEALQLMSQKGIRRLPVVGDQDALLGIFTMDDALSLLAKEMGMIGTLLAQELKNETTHRR